MNTAIKLNIIRSTCYRLRVRSHVPLSGIQIACVLHLPLVKFQQEWSQGVANPKKNASDPVSKNCHSGHCVQNVVRQTPVWRQLIIS